MPGENVEVVRRAYEAIRRGDWDRVRDLSTAQVELHGTRGGLSEGNVARGIEAVRETFEAWNTEVWEENRVTPQEFIDAGDQVLVLQHERRQGRGSGVEVESETAVLFELHGGRVRRVQGFMDRGEALEAVGLRE
jgi:ketosteroid isomerase-like protein